LVELLLSDLETVRRAQPVPAGLAEREEDSQGARDVRVQSGTVPRTFGGESLGVIVEEQQAVSDKAEPCGLGVGSVPVEKGLPGGFRGPIESLDAHKPGQGLPSATASQRPAKRCSRKDM
jgi:hypothetical protein